MIVFAVVERLQRRDLGHDLLGKYVRRIQLRDVSRRNLLLLRAGVEDHRPVGRAHVGSLTVQLRGIMHHGEEHAQ